MHFSTYEENTRLELLKWQHKMQKRPNFVDRTSKAVQDKINNIIPDKVHQAITATIKQMIRAVLTGAEFTTGIPRERHSLEEIETEVKKRIEFYKKASAAEGGITGAGGFLLALAEFPILIGIKLKLLFEIAALYGRPVNDYKERLFILHVFQLAFSSQKQRQHVFSQMQDWQVKSQFLPDDIHQFDWKTFQQEYRDYIDLAKMAQLIPGIGAAVGVIVNYRLLDKLGKTAMNAYRMRWFEERSLPGAKPAIPLSI
ncbi:EcsC family protein [Dyadobacter sp. Leaf189]|uniref:EcsC family protein n=1 Tax=Dyadobacter sp. Leaf189 TaxID=1736295 RepID=UPI0006FEC1BF|nr:EcsC family protein [Dyadobacter sp. Leaf189]KQS26950.1 ABC transporter-associated protein EcsC [Dyadobacter sp. Leaf189]